MKTFCPSKSRAGFSLVGILMGLTVAMTMALGFSALMTALGNTASQIERRIDLTEFEASVANYMMGGPLCTCMFRSTAFDMTTFTPGSGSSLPLSQSEIRSFSDSQCGLSNSRVLATVNAAGATDPTLINFKSVNLENLKDVSEAGDGTAWTGDLVMAPDLDPTTGVASRPLVFKAINLAADKSAGGTTRTITSCGWAGPRHGAPPGSIDEAVSCDGNRICIGDFKILPSNSADFIRNFVTAIIPTGTPGKFRMTGQTRAGRMTIFYIDVSSGDFKVLRENGYRGRVCYNHVRDWEEDMYAFNADPEGNCGNHIFFEVTRISTGETIRYGTTNCGPSIRGPFDPTATGPGAVNGVNFDTTLPCPPGIL